VAFLFVKWMVHDVNLQSCGIPVCQMDGTRCKLTIMWHSCLSNGWYTIETYNHVAFLFVKWMVHDVNLQSCGIRVCQMDGTRLKLTIMWHSCLSNGWYTMLTYNHVAFLFVKWMVHDGNLQSCGIPVCQMDGTRCKLTIMWHSCLSKG